MRTIEDHKVNPVNDRLDIRTGSPSDDGASHVYWVGGFRSFLDGSELTICFQKGPLNEVGANGITNEVLLAIVADRLRSFQAGKFACRENANALTKIEEAQHWLHARTRARTVRGVEGTLAA